jgi:hypothetical protein
MSVFRDECRSCAPLLLGAMLLALAPPASAQSLPDNVSAVLDVRMVGADGERSWTDEAFGKSRFGDGGRFQIDAVLAEATLVWRPPISWDVSATVSVTAQDEQDLPVDVGEAYLSWRPAPASRTRVSARTGLFWPEISLEHEGGAWTVSDMITPSAINSWVGEEVKVVGIEATASRPAGRGRIAGTIGLFGFNDTAGTLLSFRGWALHDQKTTAFSRQALPPLNPFIRAIQPQWTTPTVEIDGRPGFYARLAWSSAPVSLSAFVYSNRGDPAAVNSDLQWGWDTRFLNLGARIELAPRTLLLMQALLGRTDMGPEAGGRYWVETRFRSAYARVTHETGQATVSGRVDLFDTRETGREMDREESETGWAAAAALSWRLSDQASLIFEGLRVDSERGSRARVGVAAEQDQNIVQAALRLAL